MARFSDDVYVKHIRYDIYEKEIRSRNALRAELKSRLNNYASY